MVNGAAAPTPAETPIMRVFCANPVLCAENLACSRGDRLVFSGVGFDVEPGQALVVTGANGSGKTSLLRIVCGLLEPAAGELRWDGTKTRKLGEEYFARLGYVGHLNGLKDDLTPAENLRTATGMSGAPADEGAARTALQRLGIEGQADLPVRWLSQGQKRRAALARLLVTKRSLWVLDEPFTALDRESTATVEALLQEHLEGGGLALLATHQDLHGVRAPILRLGLGA